MIKDGLLYIAVLMFLAGGLVMLPGLSAGRRTKKLFSILTPITMLYLSLMLLCSIGLWNLEATAQAYRSLKNPLLYAMVFTLLLRCDIKKIVKLGPKMLVGFFSATITIAIGFIVSFAVFRSYLGQDAWKALGALCGSWMGGTGNLLAVQGALNVSEETMVNALVVDSIIPSLNLMFLIWALGKHERFNKWAKASPERINAVGRSLAGDAAELRAPLTWQNLLFLLGLSLLISAAAGFLGGKIGAALPFFDQTTWSVLTATLFGVLAALTPLGKLKGAEEISNVMLYIIIALMASRADLSGMDNAPAWLLCGALIILIHLLLMALLAKLLHLDLFTCCVSTAANIGGTASAPVLVGSHSSALVPVGIIMALLGYVVGTGGGLLVARIMSFFA